MHVTSQVGNAIAEIILAVENVNMYCSVYGCTSNSKCNPDRTLHFFKFPAAENGTKERKRRKRWVDFCKRKAFVPNVNSCICSNHFESAAFLPYHSPDFLKSVDFPGKFRPVLRDDALPTTAIFNKSEVLSTPMKRPTGAFARKKVGSSHSQFTKYAKPTLNISK